MVNVVAMETATETLSITDATTSIFSMASNVMDVIQSNELLFVTFCASLAFLGVGLFKAIKKAAKK